MLIVKSEHTHTKNEREQTRKQQNTVKRKTKLLTAFSELLDLYKVLALLSLLFLFR
jgi:hypothetical protein